MAAQNKLRILMLSYEYPPLGGGGAKVVYGLSKELVRRGHDVDLVTMGFRRLPRQEQVHGVNVYRIRCFRRRNSVCTTLEMVSYFLSAVPTVVRLVKQKRYHLNHTHFIFPDGLVSFIVKRLTGLCYIITAHGSDVPGYNPDRFKIDHEVLLPIWKKIVNNAERIICLSESLKSLVLEHISNDDRVLVIPNGIDLDKFNIEVEKKGAILVVSRMFERKGIQYFLEALQGLDFNHEVNIVGDGPYLQYLKEKKETLKVRANFMGWLENSSLELKKLYETSSIFVFPSESENFPIVLLEAMSASMAIITTKNTGCAEVVADTAILVEPKNSSSIREALIKLTSNPDLCKRLGQAARKRLEDNFTWNVISMKYADIYKKYANS